MTSTYNYNSHVVIRIKRAMQILISQFGNPHTKNNNTNKNNIYKVRNPKLTLIHYSFPFQALID